MRVFTFYNPIRGHADAWPLINLWLRSWGRQGWRTEVIDERDASENPRYIQYFNRVNAYPSVNDKAYEMACYTRWLAMANMEDSLAVLTDYDVINRSWKPRDADRCFLPSSNVTMLEPTRVPCAVFGTPDGFQSICETIERYEPSILDREGGRPHLSDMHILRKSRFPTANVCVEFGCSGKPIPNDLGEGWRTAPLIHFSTCGFLRKGIKGGSKVDKIKQQLEMLC